MKTKIIMAVLAVVFLAAGSAMAIPTVNYTIVDNVVTFSVDNDLTGFGVYRLGFGPTSISAPTAPNAIGWDLPSGVTKAASNGYEWFDVNPNVYGIASINDIEITYSDAPDFLTYFVCVIGQNAYTGNDLTLYRADNSGYMYFTSGRYDTTSVPEPATLLILGLGLLGIAGLKKKLHK